MMQGSNENIKEIIGIVSILNYLDLIQICGTQQWPFISDNGEETLHIHCLGLLRQRALQVSKVLLGR